MYVNQLLAWTVLLFVLFLARPSHGDVNLVGILSIKTEGVSEATSEEFEAQVEEALTGMGVQSVGSSEIRSKLAGSDYLDACLFGPCLGAVRKATGVPVVLTASMRGEGSNYSFIITLVDTRTGQFRSQVTQTCPVCTIEEAISTATLATISLLTETGDTKVAQNMALSAVSDGDASKPPASLRRPVGYSLLAGGAALGLLGAYLLATDHEVGGAASLAGGVGIGVAGGAILVWGERF